jgi:hypothetical protein|eukprot:COSAG01_NODE_92_length_27199_cov_100.594649_27_plen_64_part_00
MAQRDAKERMFLARLEKQQQEILVWLVAFNRAAASTTPVTVHPKMCSGGGVYRRQGSSLTRGH